MIHAVHILATLRPSGAETMLAAAGPLWAPRGVRCSVLATGPEAGPFAAALAAAGYEVGHEPLRFSPGFVLRLRRRLDRMRADVVHIHAERGYPLVVAAAVAPARRVVRTFHAQFQYHGRTRLRCALERRIAAALGVRHVAISPSVAATEAERFANRCRVVGNWFDPASHIVPSAAARAAARAALGLDDATTAVLMVGNCAPVKNHPAIIAGFARAAVPGAVLLHAGEEDAQRSEQALAASLGAAGRIRFLGRRGDVPTLLAAADGFVMASHAEGFGIAALEAAACGVPCLLADVPGLRDLRPWCPELTWTGTAADELERSFRSWIPGLDAGMRDRCLAAAGALRERFSPERGVDGYVALYRRMPPSGDQP